MEVSIDKSQASQIVATKEEIAEATPAKCLPCHRPGLQAFNLAKEVVAGQLEVEAAKEKLETDIGRYCIYGATDRGGCFGGTKCNYGLIIC